MNVVEARRLELGLTHKELAELYSYVTHQSISRKAVQVMGQRGLPKDPTRRAILATLLGLPLSAVGIIETSRILEYPPGVTDSEQINLEEYREALNTYQASHWITITDDWVAVTKDILRRQQKIHDTLPYVRDKKPLAEILCTLHIMLAEICEEQQLPQADTYFQKAIILAREYQLGYLYAFASFRRGVFFEVAEGKPEQASTIYSKGLAVKNLPPQLRGQLLSSLAICNAKVAGAMSEGLNLCDQAISLTSDRKEGEVLFDLFRFDSTRWYLNRVQVLLGSPLKSSRDAKAALEDLRHVTFPDDSKRSIGREITFDILSAKALIDRGDLALATQYASDAAGNMVDIRNFTHTQDIENLYTTLKASPYGNTKAVLKLSVDLLKVQHPTLFN